MLDFLGINNYNEFVVIKKWGDEKLSPRTGRPKIDNPKGKQLGVRFDKAQLEQLDTVAEYYNETRVASIRRGIEKLYSEIKK